MIEFIDTDFEGLFRIKTKKKIDERGYFEKFFQDDLYSSAMKSKRIKQVNYSVTSKPGTVRGLHYQCPPYCETKIVTCISGKIWDVAVDLRQSSPTYGEYFCTYLSSASQNDEPNMVLIPEGFAHGFQALEPSSALLYLHTEEYQPQHELVVSIDDPELSINWPLSVAVQSRRDVLECVTLSELRNRDL
jgi:dTDP-4-dehydrorhamnose 3,5-epimerase